MISNLVPVATALCDLYPWILAFRPFQEDMLQDGHYPYIAWRMGISGYIALLVTSAGWFAIIRDSHQDKENKNSRVNEARKLKSLNSVLSAHPPENLEHEASPPKLRGQSV